MGEGTKEIQALNYDVAPELYQQIKAEAERLGIPIAGFMRMLAVQYFEKKNQGSNVEAK